MRGHGAVRVAVCIIGIGIRFYQPVVRSRRLAQCRICCIYLLLHSRDLRFQKLSFCLALAAVCISVLTGNIHRINIGVTAPRIIACAIEKRTPNKEIDGIVIAKHRNYACDILRCERSIAVGDRTEALHRASGIADRICIAAAVVEGMRCFFYGIIQRFLCRSQCRIAIIRGKTVFLIICLICGGDASCAIQPHFRICRSRFLCQRKTLHDCQSAAAARRCRRSSRKQ